MGNKKPRDCEQCVNLRECTMRFMAMELTGILDTAVEKLEMDPEDVMNAHMASAARFVAEHLGHTMGRDGVVVLTMQRAREEEGADGTIH
jgi:hypothetical protein